MADSPAIVGVAPFAPEDQAPQNVSVAPVVNNPNVPVLDPTAKKAYDNAVTYGLPGMGVGLVDTLGQSLGVFDKNSVTNTLQKMFPGEDGFGDAYSRNRVPYQVGGEIASFALPGMLATKLLRSARYAREAGQLGSFLKNSAAVDVLLGNSATLTNAEANIAKAATESTFNSGIFNGRTFALPAVQAAKRSYYAARIAESARQTAAFEAGYRVLYSQSQTLAPADYTLSDQLKWAGGGLAAGAALDLAVGRYAVRALIQGTAKQVASNAAGDAFAVSQYAKDIPNVVFRSGDRGVGLTVFSAANSDIGAVGAESGSASLISNLKADQTQLKNVMATQIKEMAADPHVILPKTQLSDDQVKLGLTALDKNATSFLYATKLANVPASQSDFFQEIADTQAEAAKSLNAARYDSTKLKDPVQIKKLLDTADASYQKTMAAANEVHYVIENDGRFVPYQLRADNYLDTNSFQDIKRTTFKNADTFTMKDGKPVPSLRSQLTPANVSTPFTLTDNFSIVKPNASVDGEVIPQGDLGQDAYSALYAAGSKLIKDWKPVDGQKFILNEQLPWRQVEMTLALGQAQPEANKLISFSGDFKNLKDAQFFVQNEKYKEFSKLMAQTERTPLTALGQKLAAKTQLSPAQVMQRLNMPDPLGFQAHPLTETFTGVKYEGGKDLASSFTRQGNYIQPQQNHPYDLLQASMKEHLGLDPSAPDIQVNGPLLGQTDTRPIFVSAKSTPMLSQNDAMIHSMIESRRDLQLNRLATIDPNTAPLLSKVISNVIATPAADTARLVQTLHEGVASGRGLVTSFERVAEQFPALKAAQTIANASDKLIDNHVAELSKPLMTPLVGQLLKPANKGKLFDFSRIEQAYRYGWDIQKVESTPDGASRFLLKKDSDINKQLLEKHFNGVKIDEGDAQYMPDMSVTARKAGHVPLKVDQMASSMAQVISNMSRQSGIENNALRVALGQTPIQLRDFHLPTPELFREGTYFVRNSTGDVVGTYTGPNFKQNQLRAQEAAQKLIDTTGETHFAVSVSDAQRQKQVLDRHFFDIINYSDQLAKTGDRITGGLAHTEIDTSPETLKGMIKSLHQQFLNVGIRGRAAIFEPELNYAKQASDATGKITYGAGSKLQENNIFDQYQALMFSRSAVGPDSIVARPYGVVQDALDSSLSWLHGHFSELNAQTSESLAGSKALKRLVYKSTSEGEFAEYQKKLPDWSPFKETADWLESTYREKPNWTSRGLFAGLSKVSSSMSLRVLDVGTAINNLLGLATVMPAVVTGLRRLPTENAEQWTTRTAAWGSKYIDGVSTFSPMKAFGNASRAMWNGELTEPMNRAAKLGYFEPEYAALSKVLNDPASGGKGIVERWTDAASYLADHSEILSRKLSWGIGYKMGKELHQFDDERTLFNFANNFSNDVIGNYNPKNKPGMFQGAIGLPLGAFQTYMFNFYRRMYGYLERGDKSAMLAQYAAQASLFGAKSVPGWGLFNATMFNNYDGSDDMGTRLERKLPPGVAELVLNGSLSGIPAIFGHDSPALYTRGSVDFTQPVPTIFTASKAPPIEFLANTANLISSTLTNVFGAGGFSPQQQEEILSQMGTNRALKNIMELAANAETDRRGQTVRLGVRDAVHVASMMVSAAPSSSRHIIDAYNKEMSVQMTQSDLRATLNDKTRALIRGGEFDVDDLQDLVNGYVKSGGNTAYFGQWLRNAEVSASTPKAALKMKQLAGSQKYLEFLNMLATTQQHEGAQ